MMTVQVLLHVHRSGGVGITQYTVIGVNDVLTVCNDPSGPTGPRYTS